MLTFGFKHFIKSLEEWEYEKRISKGFNISKGY